MHKVETIKLVIFDFDGTIVDSYPIFIDSLNELSAKHRFQKIAYDEQHKLRCMSSTEVLKELRIPLWKVPAILSDFRQIMRQRINEIHPFNSMVNTMCSMMQGHVKIAIATSNSIFNVKAILGEEFINHLATLECGSTLFGKSLHLRRILEKTYTDKSQAIYVGDEVRDAQAAKRVGISFGAVAWGYTDLDALLRTNPAHVFKVPEELLSLVQPELRCRISDLI